MIENRCDSTFHSDKSRKNIFIRNIQRVPQDINMVRQSFFVIFIDTWCPLHTFYPVYIFTAGLFINSLIKLFEFNLFENRSLLISAILQIQLSVTN